MTLITTDLSCLGITMVADSALTFPDYSSGQFKIKRARACDPPHGAVPLRATAQCEPMDTGRKRQRASLEMLTACFVSMIALVSCADKQTKPVEVRLRAAVIRGNGDVVPVTHASFTIRTYSRGQILADLANRNNAGPEPRPLRRGPDYDAWAEKAYAGREEAFAAADAKNSTAEVTTNLDGEATVVLPPGTWFVTGSYSSAFSYVSWLEVEFHVTSSTTKIELSNDNGKVIKLQ